MNTVTTGLTMLTTIFLFNESDIWCIKMVHIWGITVIVVFLECICFLLVFAIWMHKKLFTNIFNIYHNWWGQSCNWSKDSISKNLCMPIRLLAGFFLWNGSFVLNSLHTPPPPSELSAKTKWYSKLCFKFGLFHTWYDAIRYILACKCVPLEAFGFVLLIFFGNQVGIL